MDEYQDKVEMSEKNQTGVSIASHYVNADDE